MIRRGVSVSVAIIAGIAMSFIAGCGDVGFDDGPREGVAHLFDADRELVVGDGLSAERALLSPDGESLALLASRTDETLGLAMVAEAGAWEVVTSAEFDVAEIAWMPDGQRLLVAYYPGGRSEVGLFENIETKLLTLDVSTGETLPVPINGQIRIEYGLAVDPSGHRAVAGGGPPSESGLNFDSQLISIDLDTGEMQSIPNPPQQSLSRPQWIDASRVVAFSDGPLYSGNWDDRLVSVDIDTGTVVPLTPDDVVPQSFGVDVAQGQVVFIGYTEFGDASLYQVSTAGESPRAFAVDASFQDVVLHPTESLAIVRRYDPDRGGFPGTVWYEPLPLGPG